MLRFLLNISLIIAITLSFTLLDPVTASTATQKILVSEKPKSGDEHVPLNTEITFKFNEDIKNFHRDKIKLYVRDIYSSFVEVAIKEINVDGKTVTIIPKDQLIFNRQYKIEVDSYTFELTNGYYPSRISNTFKTSYMSFYDLMVVEKAKLATLLNTYSNRQLIVSAPEKYIEELKINHKKQGKIEDDPTQSITESLTNIDIFLKDTDISRIKVDILNNNKVIQSRNAKKYTEKNQTFYTLSFGGLPSNFDVKISVIGSDYYTKDELIAKVASGDKLFTEVKEKYTYITAGKSFTLYELLTDDKKFNALLQENNLRKIMVQVAR
ncbi:Ig-like domain-containing protein [Cytobacillus sp. S13-E01]|uniref:Ig-like domain-containing protein n=1 Tax=Cytobacillus sp. S13-E01 TaxID=3031326 RepID=UPI0023D7D575|nr:Ig-like domain-containing protein [Cytobacillus sp. S13-E01]MDF0726037.1 Ig-like domain-containing protein [Cytobacillus sp. S13-E01]